MVRRGITVDSYRGNEVAQLAVLRLPRGQRVSVCNVYMPPTQNLAARASSFTEDKARELVEQICSSFRPNCQAVLCGDFNTRIGSRTPTLDSTPADSNSNFRVS